MACPRFRHGGQNPAKWTFRILQEVSDLADRKRVAVVVLNWNRKEMLLDCLAHVKKLTYPVDWIVVVDNASMDGSAEAVRSAYPDAVLVCNSRNCGAQEGKNIGLRKALEYPADYVYMVDNDMVVDPASLSELIRVAEQDSRVGLVGAKMYDYSKPDTLLSAGGVIDYTQNVGRGRGDREKDRGQYDRIEPVDYLWGGALLAKRVVLETVGLFDPGFTGYWFEDTDLSVRVKKAGYSVLFNPFAKAWHKPHPMVEQFSYRKKYLTSRNAIRFMKKHATPGQWAKYLFFAVGGVPYMVVRDLIRYRNAMGAVGKVHGMINGFRCKNHQDGSFVKCFKSENAQ